MNALIALLDRFIPYHILENQDPAILMRSRVLVAVCLMYSVSLFSMVLLFLTLSLLGILQVLSTLPTSGITATIYTAMLFYFKRTGNHLVATNVMIIASFLGTTAFIAATNGWESSVMVTLFCLPMIAFLMGGIRPGLWWSALIALNYLAFFVLYKLGVEMPLVIEEDLLDWLTYCSWIYAWMVLFAGMALYNNLARGLSDSVSEERKNLVTRATYDTLSAAYTRKALIDTLRNKTANIRQDNASPFLFVDFEITTSETLSRSVEDHLVQDVVRCVRGAFPEYLTLGRSRGLYFMAIFEEVDDHCLAEEQLLMLQSLLIKEFGDIGIRACMGAVMVPDYSTDSSTILKTSRKALHEARNNHQQYRLYSAEDLHDSLDQNHTDCIKLSYEKLVTSMAG